MAPDHQPMDSRVPLIHHGRMRPLLPLLACVCVVAQERPPSPRQVAEEVRAALEAADDARVATLANAAGPPPWVVADELLAAGHGGAAAAFAAAYVGPDRAHLLAYIEAERNLPRDERARRALETLREAFERRDFEGVLKRLEGIEGRGLAGLWVRSARASALRMLTRDEEAERELEACADAASALGWPPYAAARYAAAADLAAARRDAPRQRHLRARVMEIVEQFGDAAERAAARINLGIACARAGEGAKARQNYETGVALAREAGDTQVLANGLVNLGALIGRGGEAEAAEALLREGLRLQREVGNLPFEANALETLTDVLEARGERKEARAHLEAAIAIRARLGARRHEAALLRKLGDLAHADHDSPGAARAFTEALRVSRESQDRGSELYSLIGLAREEQAGAVYADAIAHAAEAARIAEELQDASGSRFARTVLGNASARVGDLDRALDLLSAVLRESLEHEPARVASAYANLGYVHQVRGEWREALHFSLEARRRAQSEGDEALACMLLGNIGNCYLSLGDRERALLAFRQCVAAAEADAGDVDSLAAALIGLGGAHWALDEAEEAAPLFERGRALAAQVGAKLWEFNAEVNLGLIALARGKPDEAIAAWERARERTVDLGTPHLAASLECYIALALLDGGDAGRAMEHATRGAALAAEGVNPMDQATAACVLGRALLEADRPREALAAAREAALALGRSVRGVPVTAAAGAGGDWHGILEIGIGGALGAGDLATGFDIYERTRAGQMLGALGGRDARHTASVPESMRAEEAGRRSALLVARSKVEAALASRRRDAVRAARAEADAAQAAYLEFVGRLQLAASAAGSVVFPNPVAVDALRAGLGREAAYVGYASTDERCYAFVVAGEGLRLVDLGPVQPIEAAVRALVEGEASRWTEEALADATALLWTPLALPSESRHVVVTPDGEMALLPWPALANGPTVALVGSATIWSLLRREKSALGEEVLALGDPAYGARSNLAALPATRAEAVAVGDKTLLGEEATEERLLEAIGSRPRWRAIHLGCHGIVDPRQPMHSALALAPGEGSDGLLTVLDIYNLRVGADLVVLSACESGRGRAYGSEGAVGFPSAFLLAGAGSVIASLWKVDDEATGALMTEFYALWKPADGSPGLGPPLALRKAQEFVRSHERWKRPEFWAAWQIWGRGD